MTRPVTPGIVARWTTRRRPAPGTACDECGTVPDDLRCDGCGQLAGHPVAMLATILDTPAGPQLVIAERTGAGGGWIPVRRLPATPDTVRALARPGATGPQPAPTALGGLC